MIDTINSLFAALITRKNLSPCVAKSSTTMILTVHGKRVLVFHGEIFKCLGHINMSKKWYIYMYIPWPVMSTFNLVVVFNFKMTGQVLTSHVNVKRCCVEVIQARKYIFRLLADDITSLQTHFIKNKICVFWSEYLDSSEVVPLCLLEIRIGVVDGLPRLNY